MKTSSRLFACVALTLAILACNLPSGQQVQGLATALALTQTAMQPAQQDQAPVAASPTTGAPPAEAPSPTATFTATPCIAFATATTAANVRRGPSTEYDAIGFLPAGSGAPIMGRNDANTWWYIAFAGGPGGYAWIAQSVTTAACLPAALQVVAAPPLPPTLTPAPALPPPAIFAVTSVHFGFSHWSDASHVNCPRVTASITTNAPGTVTYHWTRSDGGINAPSTLVFGSAGTISVKYDWALGHVWDGQTFWVGIYIDAPNHQDFGHKTFNQACTSP